MESFVKLLKNMYANEASDLHIKFGRKPIYRIKGELVDASDIYDKEITLEDIDHVLSRLMTPGQNEEFKKYKEADFAYDDPEVGRFRVNVFIQRGYTGIVFRRIQAAVPTIEELNLPAALKKISLFNDGLVLVTGPTGCGKSTTLAAMIETINKSLVKHIVTVEDPIEYLYKDDKCIINQREVGIDTISFSNALKHVLREDPDVILVGEMRDIDTFQAGINASETGHLVFGTLHTIDTLTTITRMLDFFPSSQHEQIRKVIGHHLRATVCQKLVPRKDKQGMVPVCEIMVVSSMISKLIQENKLNKLYAAMASDKEAGMQTFNQHLLSLIQDDIIEPETAYSVSPSPHTLEMNLRGIFLDEDTKIIGE